MHNTKRFLIPAALIAVLLITSTWYLLQANGDAADSTLQASGTVEALEVIVAPEISGRVVEVLVGKGEQVEAGAPLLRLDGELLQAQRSRAAAAVEAALANQNTAQTGLEMAQASLETTQVNVEAAQEQYEAALSAARQAELPARVSSWEQDLPSEFSQPAWYFFQSEQLSAAQAELEDTNQALLAEQANYATVIQSASNADLSAAEGRLARAQAAFLVAEDVLARARAQRDEEVTDFAQSIYDAAEAELEAAQSEYDRMLSERASEEVRQARARLAVAQARYDAALDRFDSLQTGEYARQVESAEIALRAARAVATQTEIGLAQARDTLDASGKVVAQAQAELELIDVQIGKLTVYAAASGVIISRQVEPGEVIQAGAPLMVIGQLQRLTITVYVPENRYGEINLGDEAQVMVDSFPGQVFTATVVHIADQAEFTPRNVQTAEGRRTTVFAVELSIDNTDRKLKPGMPADVQFGQ